MSTFLSTPTAVAMLKMRYAPEFQEMVNSKLT